jgi:acyl-CoA dehydrogenase
VIEELGKSARSVGAAHEQALADLPEDEAARAALASLAGSGLIRWCVPKRYGGADGQSLCAEDAVSARALCRLRSELAYHSGMLDVMLVMQGLGSYPLALGGSDALRARVLPEVAEGAQVAAFALTEPEAGSNLADVASRAERAGGGWILTGTKTFISNAGIADFYTVLARTSGEPGESESLSMFYVPASARGVACKRFEVMAPHPIGDVRFERVELQEEWLLGGVGKGLSLALATLERFRATVAAAATGFARRALHEACEHLKQRRQFGRPLASFQGLRFELAEMDVRLRASELLVEEAAAAVDEGRECGAPVARAKLFATESAGFICDRAVQLLGGLGVRRGQVVERLYREVRALRIYEGTSEIQKLILARELLGAG